MSNYLYFIVYDDFFKLGISKHQRKRINSHINSYKKGLRFDDIFYYNFQMIQSNAVEMALKNKYKSIEVEGLPKTECFPIEFLTLMQSDIQKYIEIFNLDYQKRFLADDFVLDENHNGVCNLRSKKEMLATENRIKK